MYINVYGDPHDPVILALHPMSITGQDLYEALKPSLSGSYFVIAPDQGGHGRSGPYVSRDEELNTLKTYLLDNGCTDIRLLYAASMGVAAAYEILKDPAFHVDKVWFDGASLSEAAPKGMGFIRPAVRMALKFYRLFPFVIGNSFVKHYGPVFGEKMKHNFSAIGDEDVVRIFTGISQTEPVEMPAQTQENMHIEWGENDGAYKSSADFVRKYLPSAQIVVRKGYGHCTYMAAHTGEYVKEVEEFLCR